jgi:CSLREA domain-containing protein
MQTQFRFRRTSRLGTVWPIASAAVLVLGIGGATLASLAQPAGASSAPAVRYLATTPRLMGAPAFTFTVNTTADTPDLTPGDGICADSGGLCSLRAAVEEANALNATVQVNVPAGTFTLTTATRLTVSDVGGLSITGAGASTVVDGTGVAGSIFETAEGPGSNGSFLSLNNLSVENGTTASDGGALNVNDTNDTAELSGVTMSGNKASSDGGAVYVDGQFWATNSTFSGNSVSGGGGGAIYNAGANIRLANDTVTGNSAVFEGGGVYAEDGTTAITGGSISNNTLNVPTGNTGDGGGIYASETTISGTTVSGNVIQPAPAATSTHGDGGGMYVDYGIGPFDALTISGNSVTTVSANGGGLYDADGMSLTNSTVFEHRP